MSWPFVYEAKSSFLPQFHKALDGDKVDLSYKVTTNRNQAMALFLHREALRMLDSIMMDMPGSGSVPCALPDLAALERQFFKCEEAPSSVPISAPSIPRGTVVHLQLKHPPKTQVFLEIQLC